MPIAVMMILVIEENQMPKRKHFKIQVYIFTEMM